MFSRKRWVSLDDGAGGWRLRGAMDEARARAGFIDSDLDPAAAFVVIGDGANRLIIRTAMTGYSAEVFFRENRIETSRKFSTLPQEDCLFLIGAIYTLSVRRFADFARSFGTE